MSVCVLGQNASLKPATPPVTTNWEDSPPISRQGTPGLPANQTLAVPPGLAVPDKSTASATQGVAASWSSNGASTSSPDSDSGPATESDNPYALHINFSESMEEEFHGMRIRAMEDDDELGALRELDSIAPGTWDEPSAAWETNAGWDNDPVDAEDLWRQNLNPQTKKPMLCNAHGIICKKGICAEYASQVRLAKRAEDAEKRKAAMSNKGKKGGRSKGRDGQKKNDENEPAEQNAMQNNQFRGPGAPVRTNWRGAPRAIVSADAVEKRDATNDASDDGWGNSDAECEPSVAAVTSAPPDAVSEASWGVPESAFDPWATTEQPAAKANRATAKPLGKKKPVQTTASSSWADQVDAELAAGGEADTFTTVSKRKSKRGSGSTTSWSTGKAKSSTSGWGPVQSDMPW